MRGLNSRLAAYYDLKAHPDAGKFASGVTESNIKTQFFLRSCRLRLPVEEGRRGLLILRFVNPRGPLLVGRALRLAAAHSQLETHRPPARDSESDRDSESEPSLSEPEPASASESEAPSPSPTRSRSLAGCQPPSQLLPQCSGWNLKGPGRARPSHLTNLKWPPRRFQLQVELEVPSSLRVARHALRLTHGATGGGRPLNAPRLAALGHSGYGSEAEAAEAATGTGTGSHLHGAAAARVLRVLPRPTARRSGRVMRPGLLVFRESNPQARAWLAPRYGHGYGTVTHSLRLAVAGY